jgi:hypothetical protein
MLDDPNMLLDDKISFGTDHPVKALPLSFPLKLLLRLLFSNQTIAQG